MKHTRVTAASFAAVLGPLAAIGASLAGAIPARGGEVPFTEHVISTTAAGVRSVFATDLDGDGDTDVLSGSSHHDDKIAWYENDGGSPPAFTERAVSTSAGQAVSVFATDLDGDGDTDVLSASQYDDKIAWYENTPACGNGSIDPAEECDEGLGCTDCLCDADFEPTAPPSLDCQATCGNGSVDPGEECDGLDDSACPGVCLSDCTCAPFCGDGACDPGENSCNCPDDCGTPPRSETPGSTCTDRLDNDCDGDADCDDPDCEGAPACEGVISPTVSEWGMMVLILALLTGIALKFRRPRTWFSP